MSLPDQPAVHETSPNWDVVTTDGAYVPYAKMPDYLYTEPSNYTPYTPDLTSLNADRVAAIAAVLATSKGADRNNLAALTDTSPGVISKVVAEFRMGHLVREALLRPADQDHRTVKPIVRLPRLDEFIRDNPSWQEAIELRAVAAKLDISTADARIYVIKLGIATFQEIQTPAEA
jgi:hypothetical protein